MRTLGSKNYVVAKVPPEMIEPHKHTKRVSMVDDPSGLPPWPCTRKGCHDCWDGERFPPTHRFAWHDYKAGRPACDEAKEANAWDQWLRNHPEAKPEDWNPEEWRSEHDCNAEPGSLPISKRYAQRDQRDGKLPCLAAAQANRASSWLYMHPGEDVYNPRGDDLLCEVYKYVFLFDVGSPASYIGITTRGEKERTSADVAYAHNPEMCWRYYQGKMGYRTVVFEGTQLECKEEERRLIQYWNTADGYLMNIKGNPNCDKGRVEEYQERLAADFPDIVEAYQKYRSDSIKRKAERKANQSSSLFDDISLNGSVSDTAEIETPGQGVLALG